MLQKEIETLFLEYPDAVFGFADISYSPYAQDYKSALVIAVPYGKQLTPETYSEQDFEDSIQIAKVRMEEILAKAEELLNARDTAYYVPPLAQNNETELLAPCSFKYAATRAGLGWIGKNDVVITRQYGPRVRLAVVLINAPFKYGQPVVESRCPEDCRKCVDICPSKALKNVRWDPEKLRAEIIDYHRCNRMRSAFIPKLGRKSACGMCFAACPVGIAGSEYRF